MANGPATDELFNSRSDAGVDRKVASRSWEIRSMRYDLTAQIDSLRSLTIRLILGTGLAILTAVLTAIATQPH